MMVAVAVAVDGDDHHHHHDNNNNNVNHKILNSLPVPSQWSADDCLDLTRWAAKMKEVKRCLNSHVPRCDCGCPGAASHVRQRSQA
jgi:hypothetical protein